MTSITDAIAPRLTAIEHAFERVGAFFSALRAGQEAARELDRYNAMSDEALARHGMNRADVTRAVVQRHFG